MMEETPVETLRAARPQVAWVSYGYRGLDGYAYIFPKVRHVNVGIGCLLSHFQARVTARPYALQAALISSLCESGTLVGRSDKDCFTPYLIPVGGPLKRAYRGRVLFAGDAGGFVNGFTAEGIYYAMVTGDLAARAIIATRGRPAGAGPAYQRLWRREVGRELCDSVRVQTFLFGDHARINRAIHAGRHLPWLTQAVVDYAKGVRSYGEVRRQVFRRAPLAVMRLAWNSTVRSAW